MNTFTAEELKTLDEIAYEWFNTSFNELDAEEQDNVYCYAEENIW